MADFTAKDVKNLRDKTNAGMMDCKKALTECNGDIEKAVDWLREKGMASAAKRAGRAAEQGAVASYIHMGGKIGVLVEVNCETDFVARCDEFQDFCKDICLQVCSTAPVAVTVEEIPADLVERERAVCVARARETGKPEKILDKIADGMLKKWYKEVVLLEQAFVKNPDQTIEELRKELSGKVGENVVIRRFARFVLGEGEDQDSGSAEA